MISRENVTIQHGVKSKPKAKFCKLLPLEPLRACLPARPRPSRFPLPLRARTGEGEGRHTKFCFRRQGTMMLNSCEKTTVKSTEQQCFDALFFALPPTLRFSSSHYPHWPKKLNVLYAVYDTCRPTLINEITRTTPCDYSSPYPYCWLP